MVGEKSDSASGPKSREAAEPPRTPAFPGPTRCRARQTTIQHDRAARRSTRLPHIRSSLPLWGQSSQCQDRQNHMNNLLRAQTTRPRRISEIASARGSGSAVGPDASAATRLRRPWQYAGAPISQRPQPFGRRRLTDEDDRGSPPRLTICRRRATLAGVMSAVSSPHRRAFIAYRCGRPLHGGV